MRKVLYLGWIGFNNFGDELMWSRFRQWAAARLPHGQYELVPSVPGVDVRAWDAYDTVVLGGGSLLIAGYVDLASEAVRAGKRVVVWGSGYDCIHLAKSASSGVVRPEAVKESPAFLAKLEETIRGAAFVGVRGPWTHAYLQEQGMPMGRVVVSGDPGLLPAPGGGERDGGAPGGRERDGDPPVGGEGAAGGADAPAGEGRWIGVNWGTAYNRIYGADEAKLEEGLAAACRELLAQGCKLYLYVVWGPDREPSRRLYEKLGGGDSAQVTYDPTLYDHEGYAALLRKFEATINLKLHANVLSAAVGVPFVSLGYRFKCFDFVHALGTPELIVPTDAERPGERIAAAAAAALERRGELAARFAAHRLEAEERLTEPFERGLL